MSSPTFDGPKLRELTHEKLLEAIVLLNGIALVTLPLGSVKDTALRLATRALKVGGKSFGKKSVIVFFGRFFTIWSRPSPNKNTFRARRLRRW